MKYVRWVVLGVFFLSGAYLLAFGPMPASERPKDRVVVRYWEKWTGVEAQMMKDIIKDFNATIGKDKGIYVEYLSMTNVNQKTLTATAAGVPPEIGGLWQDQVTQWAALDALEPLEEMAAAIRSPELPNGITKDYYKPVYWNALQYKGHLVGLISTPASIMLHWNKEYFKQRYAELVAEGKSKEDLKGFDGTRAPRTLKEMEDWCKLLTKRDKDGKLIVAGYIPSEPGWWRTRTPIWFGGHLYDEATDKFSFTSKECVEGFTWWQSFSKPDSLGFDAINEFSSGFGNFSSAQNPFLSGKVAMTLQGPWMVNFIQMNKPEWNNPEVKGMDVTSKEFKDKMDEFYKLPVEKKRELASWGVAPMPSSFSQGIVDDPKYKGNDKAIEDALIDNGAAFADFDVLVIPKGSAHKKEAFEFIAYVNRVEVMGKLCAAQGKNTAFNAMPTAEWQRGHLNPYVEYFDRIARSPNAQGLPKVPVWPAAEEALGPAVDRISRLKQTPMEAMKEAQDRAQQRLDYFRDLERKR